MIPGRATPQGTARYAARHPDAVGGFFRPAQGVTVSSLGIGTYLGKLDPATDLGYAAAVAAAVRGGINFIDTSLNYRHQRSERAIGVALADLIASGETHRDELLIATKAGFLVPDAVPAELRPGDIAGQMHSMAPAFLEDQIERSRANLGLDTVDVLYLHNPETQLDFVAPEEFYRRIRDAFATLEQLAAAGRIVWYGTATWDGYRRAGKLSLARIEQIARDVAGEHHRFRFIQLPFNLAMPEGRRAIDEAAGLGITVVASATLLQARLASQPQRAIDFTRSTRGITTALVGMSRAAHVAENLALTLRTPVPEQ